MICMDIALRKHCDESLSAHDEKQTLIRERRQMSLASQGQEATGVQRLRLDQVLVAHTDVGHMVWEGGPCFICPLVSSGMKMLLLPKAVFLLGFYIIRISLKTSSRAAEFQSTTAKSLELASWGTTIIGCVAVAQRSRNGRRRRCHGLGFSG